MSGRRHRDESGEDEGSHDFGSLRFACVPPIKTSSNRSGIASVADFSFLTLIAVPGVAARRGARRKPQVASQMLWLLGVCLSALSVRRDGVDREAWLGNLAASKSLHRPVRPARSGRGATTEARTIAPLLSAMINFGVGTRQLCRSPNRKIRRFLFPAPPSHASDRGPHTLRGADHPIVPADKNRSRRHNPQRRWGDVILDVAGPAVLSAADVGKELAGLRKGQARG
jgi:hypothetical protein